MFLPWIVPLSPYSASHLPYGTVSTLIPDRSSCNDHELEGTEFRLFCCNYQHLQVANRYIVYSHWQCKYQCHWIWILAAFIWHFVANPNFRRCLFSTEKPVVPLAFASSAEEVIPFRTYRWLDKPMRCGYHLWAHLETTSTLHLNWFKVSKFLSAKWVKSVLVAVQYAYSHSYTYSLWLIKATTSCTNNNRQLMHVTSYLKRVINDNDPVNIDSKTLLYRHCR